jgi:putative long chain acyl-CoA synthase
VQVLPAIPVTTWCRPLWRPLQAAGVPRPDGARTVFALDRELGHYVRR